MLRDALSVSGDTLHRTAQENKPDVYIGPLKCSCILNRPE